MKEDKVRKISWLSMLIITSILILTLFLIFGIDFITIMWTLALPIIGILVTTIFLTYKYATGYERDSILFSIIFLILALIIATVIQGMFYSDAISLPHRYNAACDTLEETKELLLEFENNSELAEGLESFELKKSLNDAIEKKNNLKADINAWLANSFMPYKDVLRDNLN